jgi:hypothetical protein
MSMFFVSWFRKLWWRLMYGVHPAEDLGLFKNAMRFLAVAPASGSLTASPLECLLADSSLWLGKLNHRYYQFCNKFEDVHHPRPPMMAGRMGVLEWSLHNYPEFVMRCIQMLYTDLRAVGILEYWVSTTNSGLSHREITDIWHNVRVREGKNGGVKWAFEINGRTKIALYITPVNNIRPPKADELLEESVPLVVVDIVVNDVPAGRVEYRVKRCDTPYIFSALTDGSQTTRASWKQVLLVAVDMARAQYVS